MTADTDTAHPSSASPEPAPQAARLLSLDALRGITIVMMILVNNFPVEDPSVLILTHAPWNRGVYLADFVFPWFLFCVGLAIPFSHASFQRKALPWYRYAVKVMQRMALLVITGIILESIISRRLMLGLDVLQLIGLAYMVGALFYGLPLSSRLVIAALMLAGYTAAIMLIPVPGQETGAFLEKENLIYHINTYYLAPWHLKGLLSVIPTGALAILGSAFGDLARSSEINQDRKCFYFLALGAALTGAGMLWNLIIPYNKAVWTPSYIVLMAGTGAFLLGILYYLIDCRQWRNWAYPFIVFGSNAIVAYVVPIVFKVTVLQVARIDFGGTVMTLQQALLKFWTIRAGFLGGAWLYMLTYILFWWVILWILYRRKWYVRL